MGDRANIAVHDTFDADDVVYLYAHWAGSGLPAALALALANGRSRWTDGQYLARIIFCTMVRDDVAGLTGYGISASVGDGDDRVLHVYPSRCEVVDWNGRAWSFDDWIMDGCHTC